ncbi:biotin-dependent carboxyltransferase family protein [Rheinheimera riviphila]|uniref:5-oxoprolinase subunit C family protein n=1 Tax=Rheinheimera riviphila TaxID=1834037 RepID=UPI0013E3E5F3|nr:biotin-dependent carboxyltransferase family protein [Rheinheimera riviphila]
MTAPRSGSVSESAALVLQKVNVFTQLQDLGRFGAASMGLTQGGVVDATSARLANALVDNEPTALLLEIGLGAVQFRAIGSVTVAVTGAAMPVFLNGQRYERYQSMQLQHGDQLEIGYSKAGVRCYLAVGGGFLVTPVLGSCATVLREGVGGINGQPLQSGTALTVAARPASTTSTVIRLPSVRSVDYQFQLKAKAMQNIPFVAGAQQAELGAAILARFQQNVYQVQPMSDRMGMRLRGAALPVASQALLSEGICLGAIQLPADGQPIVMLNDHQTIGGYPKIGAVTRLGVNALGQCRPGNLLRFVEVSQQQAVEQARAHELWLSTLEQQIRG